VRNNFAFIILLIIDDNKLVIHICNSQEMGYYTVDNFAQLDCIYLWWDINVVRVHYMMNIGRNNKLFLILLDNTVRTTLVKPCGDSDTSSGVFTKNVIY
jgi:hypothetical protein